MTIAKAMSDALVELVEDKVFLVDGPTGRVALFAAGSLLAAVRAFDVRQQQLWMEAFVCAHVGATRQTLWWLVDVDGWDYLTSAEPPAELVAAALGTSVWKPRKNIHGEPYTRRSDGKQEPRDSGEREPDGDGVESGATVAPGGTADTEADAQD